MPGDGVKCIYMRPEEWKRMSTVYEILGLCREAPKVEEHIAVWVKPVQEESSLEAEL